ncbi:MAG: cob(I)yrinic acid a,c-diamide adenosyltransferase [Nanoarchaeota archaeon]|nr:cob(I)yrinic acid a,c-diamide adenosyltransferase [Nanoarchaeota archaeon]
MGVYTKVGDKGRTAFFGCGMIQKDDPRIEALGAVDELNSVIGVTLAMVSDKELQDVLTKIQHDLFQVGADLAGSALEKKALPRITSVHIQEVEQAIDRIEERIGVPTKFILPGGTQASALLHLCRATTRRSERELVKAKGVIEISPDLMIYVNRLSDFFFMLARQANNEVNVKEQQPIYKYFEEKKSGE